MTEQTPTMPPFPDYTTWCDQGAKVAESPLNKWAYFSEILESWLEAEKGDVIGQTASLSGGKTSVTAPAIPAASVTAAFLAAVEDFPHGWVKNKANPALHHKVAGSHQITFNTASLMYRKDDGAFEKGNVIKAVDRLKAGR